MDNNHLSEEERNVMTKIILFIALISTYVLMVFGGIVTSTGSGLGCPDWPLCYGTFNPPPKMDAWIEWGHRLLGANAGLFILLSFISVWRNYRGLPRFTISVALIMLIVEVILGGVVVLREAPLLSEVEHMVLTSSHIIVSTIILAFISFTLSLIAHEKGVPMHVPYAVPLFIFVYMQIIIGIIVRYTQSGLACPDWPTCLGHIIPPFDNFNVFIHFLHRVVAYALVIFTGYLMFKELNPRTGITFTLVVAQMLFGIMSVFSGLFLPIVFHHILLGFFLLAWVSFITAPYLFPKGVQGEVRA